MLGLERLAVSMIPSTREGAERWIYPSFFISAEEHRGALNPIARVTATQSDRATPLNYVHGSEMRDISDAASSVAENLLPLFSPPYSRHSGFPIKECRQLFPTERKASVKASCDVMPLFYHSRRQTLVCSDAHTS